MIRQVGPIDMDDAEMEEDQSCGICIFHKTDPSNLGQGTCRRYPPQFCALSAKGPLGSTGVQNIYSYPMIKLKDWGCGEYLPNEEAIENFDLGEGSEL